MIIEHKWVIETWRQFNNFDLFNIGQFLWFLIAINEVFIDEVKSKEISLNEEINRNV